MGNHLLQRVVRLQTEVQRRDAEIQQLRQNIPRLLPRSDDRPPRNFYLSESMPNSELKFK